MTETQKKIPRILFLYPGLVPPNSNQSLDKHLYLSEYLSGDILLPVWWKGQQEAKEKLNIDQNRYQVGSCTYHFLYLNKYPRFIQPVVVFFFYFVNGLRLARQTPYRAIVSYGTNLTGIAGCFLKFFTNTKLVIDLPGVPAKAFIYDQEKISKVLEYKKVVADFSLRVCLFFADAIKLMSKKQLMCVGVSDNLKQSIFHEFVPINSISNQGDDKKYILFLGYPFYLKGVDLLIRAFKQISSSFPEYSLKIVGHCEDKSYFESLAEGNSKIEFIPGVKYEEAQELIANCSVFVLPSRTEAMGRVLLEAMAKSKVVLASDVDGIVDYVKDTQNGYLFKSEDFQDLAKKLNFILENMSKAQEVANRAKEEVFLKYSEKAYAEKFNEIIRGL